MVDGGGPIVSGDPGSGDGPVVRPHHRITRPPPPPRRGAVLWSIVDPAAAERVAEVLREVGIPAHVDLVEAFGLGSGLAYDAEVMVPERLLDLARGVVDEQHAHLRTTERPPWWPPEAAPRRNPVRPPRRGCAVLAWVLVAVLVLGLPVLFVLSLR